jgi:hypothetical protein
MLEPTRSNDLNGAQRLNHVNVLTVAPEKVVERLFHKSHESALLKFADPYGCFIHRSQVAGRF